MSARDGAFGFLERQTALLFFAASVVFALTGIVLAIEISTNMEMGRLSGVVGPIAFVLGFAGLLGMYPHVSTNRRPLGVIGAALVAIGLMGMVGVEVTNLLGLLGSEAPDWLGVLNAARYVGLVGFLLYGGWALQSPGQDARIGLLFVAAAVIEFLAVAVIVAGVPIRAILAFVAANTLAYAAIGHRLRSKERSTNRSTTNVDAPA